MDDLDYSVRIGSLLAVSRQRELQASAGVPASQLSFRWRATALETSTGFCGVTAEDPLRLLCQPRARTLLYDVRACACRSACLQILVIASAWCRWSSAERINGALFVSFRWPAPSAHPSARRPSLRTCPARTLFSCAQEDEVCSLFDGKCALRLARVIQWGTRFADGN
jgi:hypothetical protein